MLLWYPINPFICIWAAEQQKQRQHTSAGSLPKGLQQLGAGLKLGARNSSHVFQGSSRNPVTWAIWLFLGIALVGSWSQELELGIKSKPNTKDMGIKTTRLTACPNCYSHSLGLPLLFYNNQNPFCPSNPTCQIDRNNFIWYVNRMCISPTFTRSPRLWIAAGK